MTPHPQSFWSTVHSLLLTQELLQPNFLRSTISQRCKFSAPLKARPVRDSSNQLRGETFCSPSKAAITPSRDEVHVQVEDNRKQTFHWYVGITGHGSQQVWLSTQYIPSPAPPPPPNNSGWISAQHPSILVIHWCQLSKTTMYILPQVFMLSSLGSLPCTHRCCYSTNSFIARTLSIQHQCKRSENLSPNFKSCLNISQPCCNSAGPIWHLSAGIKISTKLLHFPYIG